MRLTFTVSVGYRHNKRERYIDRARERERDTEVLSHRQQYRAPGGTQQI